MNTELYTLDSFTRPAILLADSLDQAAKDSLNYVLENNLAPIWRATYPGPDSQEDLTADTINTDQIYVLCDALMICSIAMQRNNQEAQRWARGFKRYCERFATPSRGTSNGIKRDGSGFHHWSNYEGYMHSYNTFIDVLDALGSNTNQVQIGESYYLNFRDAIVAQFARARSDIRAFSLCGRHPDNLGVDVTPASLKKLATAGGRILGLTTADPEVAKVYNYLYQTNAFPGVTGSNPMEGAFQFSYAHLGVYRQNNWTAAMRGFSSYMWGAEIYDNANRYGRYQSYGSLQIIYEGTNASNGISLNGWDWNFQPGTTTIELPFAKLNGERERIDEMQGKRFAGFGTLGNKGSALLNRVHGTYGVFGMDFQEMEGQGFDVRTGPETHNNTFVFRKSVFTFDGLLIALGSNIANDDSTNRTVTTLFQHTAGGTNVVNGTSHTSEGVNTFAGTSPNWVLDRMGTGYYVPSGNNNLILSRVSQSTPPQNLIDKSDTASYQSGVFSKLYLDHGTAPSGGAYEYVAIPGTTATAMAGFAQSMEAAAALKPYQVMAKDGKHHVVKYQGNGKEVWGLCLFSNVASLHPECIVRANTGASLVMYQKHSPSSITLSVTDPDLANMSSRSNMPALETTRVLKLAGNWMAASVNTNITLAYANGQTTLTATLKDGLPQEITLQSGYLGWLAAFPSISGSTPETDSDSDGVRNLMEYALGGNPIIRDATTVLPKVQATPSGAHFTFYRSDACENDTVVTFQYSHDLGNETAWTDVAPGATSSVPDANGVQITVEENDAAPDFILITLPVGLERRIFGRVRVSFIP
jgi:chondroitin-sulfate-ABC endolyase/exolyase